jgi:hypothetical protein
MHKHPTTVTERFNAFFTTRRLVMIVGALLGVIFSKLLGA